MLAFLVMTEVHFAYMSYEFRRERNGGPNFFPRQGMA